MTVVSAPGKLMLAGEYAVLRGRPSIVAAVDKRVRASFRVTADPMEDIRLAPEAKAARAAAEAQFGPVSGHLDLDVSDLRDRQQDVKFGLGSSAAGAAAVAALVTTHHGQDPQNPDHRPALFDAALAGHEAVAKRGSGADVAASVFGGVLHYQRTDAIDVRPLPLTDGLQALIIWTGTPARTSDFIAKLEHYETHHPQAAGECLDRIRDAAETMITHFGDPGSDLFLQGVRQHHRAMDALGKHIGAPIVEARLAQIAELTEAAGGASKPSGAGGGDAAIAFFPGEAEKNACAKACREHGLALLSLQLGAEGVRVDVKDL